MKQKKQAHCRCVGCAYQEKERPPTSQIWMLPLSSVLKNPQIERYLIGHLTSLPYKFLLRNGDFKGPGGASFVKTKKVKNFFQFKFKFTFLLPFSFLPLPLSFPIHFSLFFPSSLLFFTFQTSQITIKIAKLNMRSFGLKIN